MKFNSFICIHIIPMCTNTGNLIIIECPINHKMSPFRENEPVSSIYEIKSSSNKRKTAARTIERKKWRWRIESSAYDETSFC